MKKEVVAAGFVLFSFMLPMKATAGTFSQVYAFGDSLVDNGNLFQLTGGNFPPSPYFEGRFSNGSVWTEYLAESLGLTETNLAFGGATTGTANTITLPPGFPILPGLTQQIQGFVGANPQSDANALYIVSAGANDYLNGVQDFTQPVNNLASAVTSLASVGAKNFLVSNLPDLSQIPLNKGNPFSAQISALTTAHNTYLSQQIATLNQQLNINIILFDVNSLISQAIASPGEFGFTNVTDPCLNFAAQTICANPDEYLFWDNVHPTTYTHKIVAGAALATVPEPSAALGMLALGALGATGLLKRKQKKVSVHSSKSGSCRTIKSYKG